MWLDVITAVIFVGSAALGFRRGLFSTAIHTFRRYFGLCLVSGN